MNDPFLDSLIVWLNRPGVIGIALTGSYARGVQNQYSDVDVDIFVADLPEESYTLQLFNGRLVSLKYLRLADELSALTKPEKAVWAAPGLRQMKILLDDNGELISLKHSAENFNWHSLQDAADKYAVEQLMGCAEEAQKIMGGLMQDDESKVLYASWGMFKNLSFAAAVQAGLMIESENKIFSIMQAHFNHRPAWVRAFRLSFGMDVQEGIPAYKTRGLASLDLYKETALLFKDIINNKHREVIENTLRLLSEFNESASR
ncbi:MAG TPA: nucleotidyltransferase domain-containing protein [Anaerolineales bacterium]|nr:nucleotidyltransferase domain-containing protein [Anaerolineales bacterium]HNB36181.1 nucleotidyltransferase domain-containing protein [Anaerolineales bacterium]HNC07559.1 nucleotidyltransferase domain-containing protein [Anaerolineales bacterium]